MHLISVMLLVCAILQHTYDEDSIRTLATSKSSLSATKLQGSLPPLGPSPTTVTRPSSSTLSTTILPSSCSSAVKTMLLSVGWGVIHDGWKPTVVVEVRVSEGASGSNASV